VADQLGIDRQTVYKYLQDGTLPGLQFGRKWLVSEKALVAHLDEMQRSQTLARRTAGDVPEGFTNKLQDDARHLLILAEMEARQRHHNYIGQEHILLAVARSPESKAMKALTALNVDGRRLRASVDSVIGPGNPALVTDSIDLTPRAKKAVELAFAAASENHAMPGSLQIVSGIMVEGTGVGAVILHALSVGPEQFAEAVEKVNGVGGA
jgi:excisionase family DNA binding protein